MENFDDIRCFNDDEYKNVAKRLVDQPILLHGIQKYRPHLSVEVIKDMLLSYSTINEFQFNMVKPSLQRVIDTTIDEFSISGFTGLDSSKSYTFMSNHRDIVLDSGLINYQLIKAAGFIGCEIAIGSNLLKNPIVRDLVRLNKSFMVKRNLPLQEMLEASKQLSFYIQHVLKDKKSSIWIAQREGRAKDGSDVTNPGLLKMFSFSSTGNLIDHLISMNITPVAISYEYNPCDAIILPDLLAKANGITYEKKPGEDNLHMITGIDGYKGNVHIYFGSTINSKIAELTEVKNRNELLKVIAEIIDKEIQGNYRLWKTNYIAFDLLNNSEKYVNEYSKEDKINFVEYSNKQLKSVSLDSNELALKLFYEMYATPVINHIKMLS